MWPRPAFVREANEQYVVGETYRMVELEDRSQASHDHQFAAIAEAWKNLPERIAAEFPTAQHLRKRALIETGQFKETRLDVGSKEAAVQVATTLRAKDEFAWIVVRGGVVVMREAQSQSKRAMGAEAFQESKQKVLDWVAALAGVTSDDLRQNAEKAA
jgi:hypothetical protein